MCSRTVWICLLTSCLHRVVKTDICCLWSSPAWHFWKYLSWFLTFSTMDSSQSWKEMREVLQPHSLTNIICYLHRGTNWTSSFSQPADHRVMFCPYPCQPSWNAFFCFIVRKNTFYPWCASYILHPHANLFCSVWSFKVNKKLSLKLLFCRPVLTLEMRLRSVEKHEKVWLLTLFQTAFSFWLVWELPQ